MYKIIVRTPSEQFPFILQGAVTESSKHFSLFHTELNHWICISVQCGVSPKYSTTPHWTEMQIQWFNSVWKREKAFQWQHTDRTYHQTSPALQTFYSYSSLRFRLWQYNLMTTLSFKAQAWKVAAKTARLRTDFLTVGLLSDTKVFTQIQHAMMSPAQSRTNQTAIWQAWDTTAQLLNNFFIQWAKRWETVKLLLNRFPNRHKEALRSIRTNTDTTI